MKEKTLIGRNEYVWLIEAGQKKIPARIDTGARTTSIWASDIHEVGNKLEYILFGDKSNLYTGEIQVAQHFSKIAVASSNGIIELRYRIPIILQIKGRKIKTHCTLSDRSSQSYPILIGRNTLNGKFIVDTQKGVRSLSELDEKRYANIQKITEEGMKR